MTDAVMLNVFCLARQNLFLHHLHKTNARRRVLSIIEEKSLERMEALLSHSAIGVHVLFDNKSIASVLSQVKDDKDFYDFNKMKKVQDVMTELIAKRTYIEKVAYLKSLEPEAYEMVVRAYFHIVENTARANQDLAH
jgi:hypothetical protein